jgi:hypothetical protein
MASELSRGKAALAWCTEETKHTVMDTDLAEAFANILDEEKKNMETQETKSLRFRVNIKETAKKEKYWEFTVDGTGCTDDEVLEKCDGLQKKLEMRYPASEVR